MSRSIAIHDIVLGVTYLHGSDDEQRDIARMGEELAGLIAKGDVVVPDIEQIKFDAIPNGLRRLRERHVRGKLVAVIDR